MKYNKWQLRRFAREYLKDYNVGRAAMESNIDVDDADSLLLNPDFIEQVTKVNNQNDMIEHHKDLIEEWIGEGKTLRDYCRQDDAPSFRVVYRWLENDKQFATRFAQARKDGYDMIAQECLAIADTPINEIIETESDKGYSITKRDAIKHRNLQIDTRLKLLAKWDPRRYGNIQQTEITGRDGGPIETVDNTPANDKDIARRLAFLLQKGAKQDESTE